MGEMSETNSTLDYPQAPVEGLLSAHSVKVFIALAVVVGAFGYFALIAFQSATLFYYAVGELHDVGPTEEGRSIRLSGKLVPDSFHRDEGSTVAQFTLTDGDATMEAFHEGVLPDLFFNEHSEIILEGSYLSNGTFESYNVSVKCPSKYIAAS